MAASSAEAWLEAASWVAVSSWRWWVATAAERFVVVMIRVGWVVARQHDQPRRTVDLLLGRGGVIQIARRRMHKNSAATARKGGVVPHIGDFVVD